MFFKDIADFKTVIPMNANFAFSEMSIYLKDVDRTILKKYLGKDLLTELQDLFDATPGTALVSPVKELVELIRQSSAHYALEKWIPFGQVNISQLGITINKSENMATAFQWQIKDIQERCLELGFNALEDALEYLEDNLSESVFESYKTSDEFKANNYLFVNSAKTFCEYFSSFDSSRINFFKLRSVIRKVEDFQIKAVLLPDLFKDLKDQLQTGDALGPIAKALIERIQPALVNLVIAKGINDLAINVDPKGIMYFDNTGGRQTQESKKQAPDMTLARIAATAQKDGEAYLTELAEYLEANKEDYPDYTGDAKYIDPVEEDFNPNEDNDSFFNALS